MYDSREKHIYVLTNLTVDGATWRKRTLMANKSNSNLKQRRMDAGTTVESLRQKQSQKQEAEIGGKIYFSMDASTPMTFNL